MMVIELTDLQLEGLITSSPGLNLVAFFGGDPTPCRAFRPEWEAIAQAFRKKLLGTWALNIDENPEICEELQVEIGPVVILFCDGEEKARWSGPYTREALTDRLDEVIIMLRNGGQK